MTPLVLPKVLPIWIDTLVMDCEYVVLGGGNRSSKLKVSPQVLVLQAGAEVVSNLALRV